MTSLRLVLCLAAPLLLSACANLSRDMAAYANAKSCCASVQALPTPIPFGPRVEATLGPESSHFDFGQGLAPFIQVKLEPGKAKVLALGSPAHGSGILTGGDGTYHYVDLQPIFLAADGQRLPDLPLTPPVMQTDGLMGRYMYVRFVEIPASAATVVLTGSAQQAGRRGALSMYVSGGGYMVGGVFMPILGGRQSFPYTLVPYGDIVLRFTEAGPR